MSASQGAGMSLGSFSHRGFAEIAKAQRSQRKPNFPIVFFGPFVISALVAFPPPTTTGFVFTCTTARPDHLPRTGKKRSPYTLTPLRATGAHRNTNPSFSSWQRNNFL